MKKNKYPFSFVRHNHRQVLCLIVVDIQTNFFLIVFFLVANIYACARQKKHKCDKKMLHKDKIENYIVYKTMQLLQSDDCIEYLSNLLYEWQFNESTMLPKLESDLKAKRN